MQIKQFSQFKCISKCIAITFECKLFMLFSENVNGNVVLYLEIEMCLCKMIKVSNLCAMFVNSIIQNFTLVFKNKTNLASVQ